MTSRSPDLVRQPRDACRENWITPLALLAASVLAFGLLVPFLGFYWDDWETILVNRMSGAAQFWRYFRGTRPLAAWTYVLVGPILGARPLNWQVFTLLLRWATAVAYWRFLLSIWPENRREAGLAAFLFLVYPVFTQQSVSVAYHQHWMGYVLYFVSLTLMVEALHNSRRKGLLLSLSIGAQLLHLSIFEYFIGVELLRPLVLWFASARQEVTPTHKRLRQAILFSAPSLAVTAAFSGYRIIYSWQNGGASNAPRLLFGLVSSPLTALSRLLGLVLQDTAYMLVTSWYGTFAPELINLRSSFVLISWALAAGGSVLLTVFLLRLRPLETGLDEASRRWPKPAFILGVAATLLGSLPAWLTDRSTMGGFSHRFALASMFGASLVWVAWIEWFGRKNAQKVILVSALVGLAVGFHVRVGNEYRWSWIRQERFYWQLYWRAPAILPNTSILSEGDVFPFVRPTHAINLLYLEPQGTLRLPYHFFLLGREVPVGGSFDPPGVQLTDSLRGYEFEANSRDSLVVFNNPPASNCLWVLSGGDREDPALSDTTVRALTGSNLTRILDHPDRSGYPPQDVFGREPAADWCYFYEKADLARQYADWARVADLGDRARGRGYLPDGTGSDSVHEWLPFIEGYSHVGRWEEAAQLTLAAEATDSRYRQRLCVLWQNLQLGGLTAEKGQPAYQEVTGALRCGA